MKKYLLGLFLAFYSLLAFAEPNYIPAIQKVTQDWAVALSSNDPQKIAGLYDQDAILYATFTNKLNTPDKITAYFTQLMKHPNLKVEFKEQNIRVFWETAINSGLYEFSYNDGKEVKVPARYTFVYILGPNGWKIVEHHSSVLPE